MGRVIIYMRFGDPSHPKFFGRQLERRDWTRTTLHGRSPISHDSSASKFGTPKYRFARSWGYFLLVKSEHARFNVSLAQLVPTSGLRGKVARSSAIFWRLGWQTLSASLCLAQGHGGEVV